MPRGAPGVPIRNPETRLLAEYLAQHYPTSRIQMQPRLGQPQPATSDTTLTEADLRAIGVWRRYPDAIVFGTDHVTIIEASLKPDPGKIGILDLYAHLFPLTPEFAEFKALRVDKLMVWGMGDSAAQLIASQHGIRVDVFTPDWLYGYLDTLRPRDKRPPQTTAVVSSS